MLKIFKSKYLIFSYLIFYICLFISIAFSKTHEGYPYLTESQDPQSAEEIKM